jgi:hypothetical protein
VAYQPRGGGVQAMPEAADRRHRVSFRTAFAAALGGTLRGLPVLGRET